jgi:pimeloyl-ACP methyl ester carboxylesterase
MKTNGTIIRVFRIALMLSIVCLLSVVTFSQIQANNILRPKEKGYAPVNGLKMYYEIYGEGTPLVLIHGAFMTINTNFGDLIPELSKNRKVIALELQGHGRTADIDRPFSAETMADDVAALLQYLKVETADIFGYSLGGEVALQIGIRHPQMVRRLIVVSAAYRSDGWTPQTRALFPLIKPEFFTGTPIKKAYDSLAPDPKNFPELVNKIKIMSTTPFDFTDEKIKSIKCPVLIMIADGDGVLPEHALAMYRLLGGDYMVDFGPVHKTQLAIFPGSSHISIMLHPEWMLPMMNTFLDAKM